jgi:biotin operon repressor
MSNHLTSEVYKRRVGAMSRNAVLVLLADKASDDGSGIWASKQRMADELGCSKQTVIDTIKGLIADGLLIECGHRANPNGYTVEYAIVVSALLKLPLVPHHDHQAGGRHQSSSLTGQKSGPVSEIDGTGPAAGPHQSSSLTQTPLNHPKPPRGSARARRAAPDLKTGSGKQADAADAAGGQTAGAPLPADWTAPAVADLPPLARKSVEQWPAGAYEAVCETFRCHWHGETGPRSFKRDWTAALAKWLLADHAKIMRDAKAGVSFAHLAPTANAVLPGTRAVPRPVAAKRGEDERSAAIHAELRRELGEQLHDQWLAPAAVIQEANGVAVIVASEFHRSWLEDRFMKQIRAAATAVIGTAPRRLRIEVERTAQGETA